jgi:3'-5' exonuclease
MNVFAFDIETVADIEAGRKLYGERQQMEALDAKSVERVMLYECNRELEQTSNTVAAHLHKVVAISGVFRFKGRVNGRSRDDLELVSLGNNSNNLEANLIHQFFAAVNKYATAQPSLLLVSWNGNNSHLAVLQYRALLYGVNARRYWKFNYPAKNLSHHLDLADKLSNQAPILPPLHEFAKLLDFPSYKPLTAEQICDLHQQSDLAQIQAHCEAKVINIYLIYLRFMLTKAMLDVDRYGSECNRLHKLLASSDKQHLNLLANNWKLKS